MFFKPKMPIKICENNILFDLKSTKKQAPFEYTSILKLIGDIPIIRIFQDYKKVISYSLDTLKENPSLNDKYLDICINVTETFGVQIDGIISESPKKKESNSEEENKEGIIFQRFFLNISQYKNDVFYGKGLIERAFVVSGRLPAGGMRLCCVCDVCKKSFCVNIFHAGYSEVQYFYSSDSSVTLVVPYGAIDNMPYQLQKEINQDLLKEVESKLPKPMNGSGNFQYYNPFRCPHCKQPYIDFQKYPEIRPFEYYGCYHLNNKIQYYEKKLK